MSQLAITFILTAMMFTSSSFLAVDNVNTTELNCDQTGLSQKLHVAVYYESLCSDSINFFTDQLAPSYELFKDHLELLFVPFGKSESTDDRKGFYCQHGPAECTGNLIQSCALDALKDDQDAKVQFVTCQMKYSAEFSGEECGKLVNITYDQLLNCSSSSQGIQLQLEAEEETHRIRKPYPRFVPTIVYNRTFNTYSQRRSLYEFPKVVCDKLKLLNATDELPSICHEN